MRSKITVLNVDLSTRETSRSNIPANIAHAYLGGRGIATWLLAQNPSVSPLEAGAPLIFAAGALNGSHVPASSHMTMAGFSPLTDTICTSSVGGSLGIEMRRAGCDIIRITGRAQTPVIMRIRGNDIEFTTDKIPEAADLSAVFDALGEQEGSIAVAGRAAFQGCRYANIVVDREYSSGRGGLGLVMASKNLRAVTIKGSRKLKANDTQGEKAAGEDIIRLFDASPALMGRSGLHACGTAALVDLIAANRMMPTANFRRTYFEGYQIFNAGRIREEFSPQSSGCPDCPIACKKTGAHAIPEYDALSHFGALNENDELDAIMEATRLCDEAGMDPISTAATLSCLAEIRGKKLAGADMVEKVAAISSGRDSVLRDGSARLAAALGKPWTSMSIKGLELPAYDPRGAYGLALAYGTSTRGACHLQAYPISHEILRKPVATDRFSFDGKARIIKIAEDQGAVAQALGICPFALLAASLEEYARAFTAVTGMEIDVQELLARGDNMYTLERHINCLRGFSAGDDYLPRRFYLEAGSSGAGITIAPIDKTAYTEALGRYYHIRGCLTDGTLSQERLDNLLI